VKDLVEDFDPERWVFGAHTFTDTLFKWGVGRFPKVEELVAFHEFLVQLKEEGLVHTIKTPFSLMGRRRRNLYEKLYDTLPSLVQTRDPLYRDPRYFTMIRRGTKNPREALQRVRNFLQRWRKGRRAGVKLGVLEKRALKTLQRAWEWSNKPVSTVHSAYGLMRRSYYTKRVYGIGMWFRVLEKLVEKGLLKHHKYKPTIYELTPEGWEVAREIPEEYYMR